MDEDEETSLDGKSPFKRAHGIVRRPGVSKKKRSPFSHLENEVEESTDGDSECLIKSSQDSYGEGDTGKHKQMYLYPDLKYEFHSHFVTDCVFYSICPPNSLQYTCST